jgi:plasmid stabilization system protein ParE
MQVIISAEALADLAAIRTYIGAENPYAASRVAGRSWRLAITSRRCLNEDGRDLTRPLAN